MQLSKEVKITQAITATDGAAGTTAINGATLDMSGWEGVLMVVNMGAITASAVTSINAAQSAASNFAGDADLLGSGQSIADDDDENTYYIDVYKPSDRYVRLEVARATANAVVSSATYIQYGPRTKPNATHGSAVAGESHVSPAEGTA